MRRITAILLLLALLLAIALPVAALLRSTNIATPGTGMRVTQVDTNDYPQITLYVDARDPNGQQLLGLDRSDFAINEDGTPVEITSFAGGGGPISAVLVIDRSGSMGDDDKLEGAQEAAQAFVESMRPEDQTALIAFNSRSRTVQGFSSDPEALGRQIERLDADGGTALYDAIIAGVDTLRNAEGRRALIVLSDGTDCREPGDDCPAEYGSEASLEEAIDYANAANQPVYLVGLGDKARDGDAGIDEGVLQQIASDTSGDYFYAPQGNELAELYTRLAGNIQQEYLLTYTSPRPFYDGTRRDIEVLVGGEGVASSYTERHLINIASNPLVGLGLLVPLAALLALPAVRRRGKPTSPASIPSNIPAVGGAAPAIAVPPLASQPAATANRITIITSDAAHCPHCDRPLRAGAKFCSGCGKLVTSDE
jgi:Ca-activated chloride channel homolog